MLIGASNSQALWYMTRGFGLMTLVLLTVSVVLGITQVVRLARPGVPRFVLAGLHRNVSLLAIALLAVHIVTAVSDPFAPIGYIDAFVPFVGRYRPLWLGLGALASDLLIALVLSSLVRQRLGFKAWRAVHWAAYACWPIAVVHGLGTGSDSRVDWVQGLYAVCVLSVLAAFGWRLVTRWSGATVGRRVTAAAAAAVVTGALAAWTLQGPLRPGWAGRAGTPPADLGQRSSSTGSGR